MNSISYFSGLSQKDNIGCYNTEQVQEWFKEHSNEFEVLTWSPDSSDLPSISRMCYTTKCDPLSPDLGTG